MSKKVAVIGAGPGGYVAAIRAAQLGAQVTVIEQENVGGTCLNWGCVPSKVLKTTAEMMENLRRAREFGIVVNEGFYPDMLRLMTRKQKVIQDQREGILKLFKHHKITHLRGTASIKEPAAVTVKPAQEEPVDIPWDRLILAPGSKTTDIPSFPFDGERVISSNDALELSEIPSSVLIIGGGVIGCEFAFILSSLGSQVSIVEAMSRVIPLPCVDEDCSKVLQREMKKKKITFFLKRTVEQMIQDGAKIRVTLGPSPFIQELKKKDRIPMEIEVEKVLICIGRKSNTAGMGLEKLGVKTDDQGWLLANNRLETNIPHVYAVGDALGPCRPMLAHMASAEGAAAGENAMGGNRAMDYSVVPGAIFTMPEVAHVGLTESHAREQGMRVRADSVLFRTVGKAQIIGEIAGQAKIVSDVESGRIVGVHMIGPHAAELIAEGTLAMKMGGTVEDLAETIHAHPTLSESMLEVSLKALDKALHG